MSEDAHVIGVDVGALPGRAVVARGEQLPPDRALHMPSVDRTAGTRGRTGLPA